MILWRSCDSSRCTLKLATTGYLPNVFGFSSDSEARYQGWWRRAVHRSRYHCRTTDILRTGNTRFFSLFALALILTMSVVGQANRGPLEGVWQAVEVTHFGSQALTIKPGPNLTVFAGKHYSRIDVQTEKARPVTMSIQGEAPKSAVIEPWTSFPIAPFRRLRHPLALRLN